MEQEIQTTKTRLSSVTNDVNARKQDFMALINTEQKLEQNLEHYKNQSYSIFKTLDRSQTNTASMLYNEIHIMSNRGI